MKPWMVILGLLVLIALYIIAKYNEFAKLRVRVNKTWKDIDIQLKRRFDLIPNVVESVKGYMKHEGETFEKIAKLRSGYQNAESVAEKTKIANELDSVSRNVMVTFEQYPELKSNENVMMLQTELKNTEDKITYSRQFYNDIAGKYNAAIIVFPGNVIASLFKFKEADLYEIQNAEERENVKVEF